MKVGEGIIEENRSGLEIAQLKLMVGPCPLSCRKNETTYLKLMVGACVLPSAVWLSTIRKVETTCRKAF